MPNNSELNKLKAKRQSLFEQKQAAFWKFKQVQKQVDDAHDVMEAAWEERIRARDRMNSEFLTRQAAFTHYNEVWGEYVRIRNHNNSVIGPLKREADAEHRAMQECYERASSAYRYGDKSEAPYYSQEGREHRDRRDELNAEISELIRETRQAKANAEALAPRVDSSAFYQARNAFEAAKARHEPAQAEFKRLKALRDSAKAEFDELHARFKQVRDEINRRLEEIRASKSATKQHLVDKVI